MCKVYDCLKTYVQCFQNISLKIFWALPIKNFAVQGIVFVPGKTVKI
jgi:hypothetical protein